MDENSLVLPIQVTSRSDVAKLLLEIEKVDEFLEQSAIREPGTSVKLPKTSRLLEEFATNNKLNLLHDGDRTKLIGFLTVIRTKAPQLHISFSADAPPLFTQKILNWLRTNIHPVALLKIGLQPNIGAGCMLRGNSLYLDLSLKNYFQNQRSLLVEKLHEGLQEQEMPDRNDVNSDQVNITSRPTEHTNDLGSGTTIDSVKEHP